MIALKLEQRKTCKVSDYMFCKGVQIDIGVRVCIVFGRKLHSHTNFIVRMLWQTLTSQKLKKQSETALSRSRCRNIRLHCDELSRSCTCWCVLNDCLVLPYFQQLHSEYKKTARRSIGHTFEPLFNYVVSAAGKYFAVLVFELLSLLYL